MDFDSSEASHSTKKLSFVIIYFCHFLLFHLTLPSAASNLRLCGLRDLFSFWTVVPCFPKSSCIRSVILHQLLSPLQSSAIPKLSSSLLSLLIQCFSLQRFQQLSYRHFNSHCTLFYIYHIKTQQYFFCAFKTTNFKQMFPQVSLNFGFIFTVVLKLGSNIHIFTSHSRRSIGLHKDA